MILQTITDLPLTGKNCATCHRKADSMCPRTQKRFPNGYVMNSVTGEIGGMITGCLNWQPKERKQLTLF